MMTMGFPSGSTVKNLPEMQETWVQSPGWDDPLEKGTATTPVFIFIALNLEKFWKEK